MNPWRPYPLLRLVFPFVAGIIAELSVGPIGGFGWLLPALLSGLLLAAQIIPMVFNNYRLRWITGLPINIFLLFAGYEIAVCHQSANDPDFLGKHNEGLFLATIAEPPVINASGIKAILEVRFRCENGHWVRVCGRSAGYLKYKDSVSSLNYGDYILLQGGFTEICDNSNPHVFNYARYLKNKGISHRVFAEPHCWRYLKFKPSGFIRKVAFQVRDRLLNILRHNHVKGKEFAVTAALLLGYVNDLDADLRSDYAASGAMHILSVSGMHVGIIYIFLEFLLGFLNKSKSGRLIKAILLLTFIWFYAMVTGLSPCVLRSAAMLSLPILGKSLSRSPNMYNIIAASIIFILAVDPFLILDIGFQLSYLAVTGIVILYKPIYNLYVNSAWLPDKIWSILAVSIAAQIATLPITLYTFHQFPNYFMLTNIFVVPLSSLIIYVGIVVLAVGYIPVISVLSAKLLIALVWLLNTAIHFVEQLPYSTIRGIFISIPEMFLLYMIITALFLFLTSRKISFLYIFFIASILLNLYFLDFKVNRLRSSRLVIFNASQEALYLFSTQDKAMLLYGGKTRNIGISQKQNRTMIAADLQANGIHYYRDFWLKTVNRHGEIAKSFVPVITYGNFIQFADCRIVLLRSSIPKGFTRNLDVDLLIITSNPKINVSEAIKLFHPVQIIIDATNSRYKTLQWLKDAAKSGVSCHSVTENGAYQKVF